MLPALLSLLLLAAPPPGADEDPLVTAPGPVVNGPVVASGLIETPRFHIVYTPASKGAAEYLADRIEPLRDEVAALIGRDWPGKTELRLGFGHDEYLALAIPGAPPPSWAVALAYPDHNVVLIEAHSLTQADGQLTLRHELVHVALGQLAHGWPRWFQEGMAMHLTGERAWRVSQYAVLSRAVTQDRVFFFENLSAGFPRSTDDVEIAYAQSVEFIEFLEARHGRAAFGTLIDRMHDGEPFEQAFATAFHTSFHLEERDFRAELPRRYPWWPLLLSGGTLIWAVSSVLTVMAWFRRRKQVQAHRRELLRLERLEDLGEQLLARGQPANEDVDVWEPLPDHNGHWVIYSVRLTRGPSTSKHLRAAGDL